jgi:biopolymer transport protein ExbD
MAEFETEGKPNLTPILDMVFQLITFFMVVANFKAASIEKDLQLPVVGSARPVDTRGVESLMVLNIDRDGNLKAMGRRQPLREFVEQEANAVRLAGHLDFGQELPALVVVRADRQTRFRDFNRVIRTCQEFGFRQFALKTEPPGKKGAPGKDSGS